jgi:glycosyltransferase involved in cell wall biosynthesis
MRNLADRRTLVSIIVPVYNERDVLPLLRERLTKVIDGWTCAAEIIAIDDGSRDGTDELLDAFAAEDPRIKVVHLSRNFGHQAAVSAGLVCASGDCVAIIDADLQDPPEMLESLLGRWEEGIDVVYAIRRRRKEGWLRRTSYYLFYRILQRLSAISIPLDTGDFCVMDRAVVESMNRLPESSRFVRGLRCWVGFRHEGLDYERQARAAGEPKYGLLKLLQLAADGIFSFSIVPLRIITCVGLLGTLLSFIGLSVTVYIRVLGLSVFGMSPSQVPGYASLFVSLMFLSGLQLLFLGVLGEYLGRFYLETKRRPNFIAIRTIGVEPVVGQQVGLFLAARRPAPGGHTP